MNLRERFALGHLVTSLCVHDDADRVVDRILLRPPAGAEVDGGSPNGDRAQRGHDAVCGRLDRAHDRSRRERILVGSPLLIRSTLVRLFYLDARYSRIFKPFARKSTLVDEEVASFKIGWDD